MLSESRAWSDIVRHVFSFLRRQAVPLLLFGLSCCAGPGDWHLREVVPGEHYLVGVRDGNILIDGRLDDPGWSHVPSTRPFRGKPPDSTDAELEARARWSYDSLALYLAFTVTTTIARRGSNESGESLEVMVDLDGDTRSATRLRFTPLGLEAINGVSVDRSEIGSETQAVRWATGRPRTKTDLGRQSAGWTLEAALPWTIFKTDGRFPPAPRDRWAVRLIHEGPHEASTERRWWGPDTVRSTLRTSGLVPDGSGWLEFLGGPLP